MIVPETFHDLLHQVSRLLGRDRFTVFGGAARDLITDSSTQVHDLDVAIDGTLEDARHLAATMAAHRAVGQVTPVREYWIFHRRPLTMFTADLDGLTIDINIMACPLQAHFDVETVQWHYPSLIIDDPHQVTMRTVDQIRLLSAVDDENPILLLNRVLRLAAKYDLPLTGQPLVAELSARAARWWCTDQFHGREAHLAHHRAVADAVLRSAHPQGFLTDCLHGGVLDARLKPLADTLRTRPATIAQLAAQRDRNSWWAVADQLVGDPQSGWRGYAGASPPLAWAPAAADTDLVRWSATPASLPV